MTSDLKIWRWDSSQLALDAFRASGVPVGWKAVIAEGHFLPGDAERVLIEYGPVDTFVGDVLWAVGGRLQSVLVLERPGQSQRVANCGQLERLLPGLIGLSDYRFAYYSADSLRAVGFDVDIDWPALLCEEDLADEVDGLMQAVAAAHGRVVKTGYA